MGTPLLAASLTGACCPCRPAGCVSTVSRLRPLLATTRLFSVSIPAKGKIPEGFAKIKERQKFFNLDNGLRVHQRGGMVDSLMYNVTLLLIFIGALEYLRVLYGLVFPKTD